MQREREDESTEANDRARALQLRIRERDTEKEVISAAKKEGEGGEDFCEDNRGLVFEIVAPECKRTRD